MTPPPLIMSLEPPLVTMTPKILQHLSSQSEKILNPEQKHVHILYYDKTVIVQCFINYNTIIAGTVNCFVWINI